jgi:hypothetical protein
MSHTPRAITSACLVLLVCLPRRKNGEACCLQMSVRPQADALFFLSGAASTLLLPIFPWTTFFPEHDDDDEAFH